MKKERGIIYLKRENGQTTVEYSTRKCAATFSCQTGVELNNAIKKSITRLRENRFKPVVKDERTKENLKSVVSIKIREEEKKDSNSTGFCWLVISFKGTGYNGLFLAKYNEDIIAYIKKSIRIIKFHGDSAIIEDYLKKERAEEIFKHNLAWKNFLEQPDIDRGGMAA